MKEKKYVEPEMEVTMFDSEDVITTSGGVIVDPNTGITLPDDNWN